VAIDAWALGAIRAAVLAPGVLVEDDPLLPRGFQLSPFRVAHGAAKKAEHSRRGWARAAHRPGSPLRQ
jgi:hypothetical protein